MSRHIVVLVTSSYPRFPGDTIGTFMEPIAKGLAARGHEVHVVLPWHPLLCRGTEENGVHFHPYRYAPLRSLNVFGYSGALRADVRLRGAAYVAAPLALASAWRATRAIARRVGATIAHGHWVVPSGAVAAAAVPRLPLVISLHGSDVYLAERTGPVRWAARAALQRAGWITACSDDLRARAIAIGAPADRSETVPYGVDADRFRPNPQARAARRRQLGIQDDAPLLFTAGRFVRKKGFEYLIDAVARLADRRPPIMLAVAGGGDLDAELRARAAEHGLADRVRFVGVQDQDAIADYLAAADLAVVPSVRDEAGNVDGLPNFVLEALASATPVVTTTAGGIGAVAADGRTAAVVPERDAAALAGAIARLLDDPQARGRIGRTARDEMIRLCGWARVAERFEAAYDRARRHHHDAGDLAL